MLQNVVIEKIVIQNAVKFEQTFLSTCIYTSQTHTHTHTQALRKKDVSCFFYMRNGDQIRKAIPKKWKNDFVEESTGGKRKLNVSFGFSKLIR